jgi:hypothetical protein
VVVAAEAAEAEAEEAAESARGPAAAGTGGARASACAAPGSSCTWCTGRRSQGSAGGGLSTATGAGSAVMLKKETAPEASPTQNSAGASQHTDHGGTGNDHSLRRWLKQHRTTDLERLCIHHVRSVVAVVVVVVEFLEKGGKLI